MLTLLVGVPARAPACDICAIYTATEMQETRSGPRLGIAEQFTRFATLQEDGEKVPNPAGEYLNSSITQFVFGYHILPRLGVQLNLPWIYRGYRRNEASGVSTGDVNGFGDLSLLANALAYSDVTERGVLSWSLLFGLKLPSGSSSLLAEESAQDEVDDHPHPDIPPIFQTRHFQARHSTGGEDVMSGIHGHDLALGSGSTDVVFGTHGLWTLDRLYVTGALQYMLRTTGSFDYRYANELIVAGGPGLFALVEHDYTLGVQALLTCDTKGMDTQDGEPVNDTALTALYIGPSFHFTWGSSLSADLIADIPVVRNNSGLQIVPDYRLRGGVLWRF
jgi:hypothetical protein